MTEDDRGQGTSGQLLTSNPTSVAALANCWSKQTKTLRCGRPWHQKKHPRFVLHFVPASSSWLNLVERWFGELTSKRIRRGSFFSVPDLIAAIEEFLEAWNENPRPFVWTATVESIVAKLSGCRQTLEQIQPGCTLPRQRRQRRLSS